ncbi:MAG: GNAT family N-acetyltransferase [Roseburia sp.]|nr:GNAT family N-acetyltransferase [Roseburia sp.]
MALKDELKKLWRDSFGDSAEYVDMYFDRVYTDADAIALSIDGRVVSSLLLQPYNLWFHGTELPIGYIAGASTRRQSRGKGFMGRLIFQSLTAAYCRGMAAVALIPAHDWLYDYYARFGFATVFYADAQRYTSLHAFAGSDRFSEIDDSYSTEVIDAFMAMERDAGCGIIHSRRDFLNILDDLNLEGGLFCSVTNNSNRCIVAMGWAAPDADGDRILVKELLGDDPEARKAVLRRFRAEWPDMPFTLLARPGCQPEDETDNDELASRRLMRRGMMRIVDNLSLLEAIAAGNPHFEATLRISDPMLPQNNHVYRIVRGKASEYDSFSGTADFDVDAPTFCRMVFSSPAIGEIIEFPSVRPHISLMLD